MPQKIFTAAQRKTAFVWAIIGAVCFSFKAICAKLIYREGGVEAVDVIALRMLFSLPFFIGFGLWARRTQPHQMRGQDYAQVIFVGFIGYYLSSILDFMGLQYISVGLERLLLFLVPSIVLIISKFVLKKTILRAQWLAMMVAYSGIVLVFWHELQLPSSNAALGGALVFASAVSYAGYLLLTGELVKRLGAIRLVAYAMATSTLCSVLHYLVVRDWQVLWQHSTNIYIYSMINAVLCTVTPVLLTMLAVRRLGPALVSQVGMIGPVMILGFGYWFLGEPITWIQLAGTALVLLGIGLVGRVASAAKPV